MYVSGVTASPPTYKRLAYCELPDILYAETLCRSRGAVGDKSPQRLAVADHRWVKGKPPVATAVQTKHVLRSACHEDRATINCVLLIGNLTFPRGPHRIVCSVGELVGWLFATQESCVVRLLHPSDG